MFLWKICFLWILPWSDGDCVRYDLKETGPILVVFWSKLLPHLDDDQLLIGIDHQDTSRKGTMPECILAKQQSVGLRGILGWPLSAMANFVQP